MPIVAPPETPLVTLADGDGLGRVRFRLWQMLLTTITVFTTTWLCTFGPIPAIFALMVAKHVLVAIYVMGIDMGYDREES